MQCLKRHVRYFLYLFCNNRLIVWLDFKSFGMDRTDSVQYTVLFNQCSNQCYHIHQSAGTFVSYNRSPQQVGISLVTKLHVFILHVVLSSWIFGKFSDWIILINTKPISLFSTCVLFSFRYIFFYQLKHRFYLMTTLTCKGCYLAYLGLILRACGNHVTTLLSHGLC